MINYIGNQFIEIDSPSTPIKTDIIKSKKSSLSLRLNSLKVN